MAISFGITDFVFNDNMYKSIHTYKLYKYTFAHHLFDIF